MERQGRVHRIYEDGTALVLCTDCCAMECDGCAGCRQETEALIARNPIGAQLGELVLVHPRRGSLLGAVLMLLVVPIAGFFVGYWLGAALWGTGKWIGCIAFAFGIGIGLIYDRCVASKHGGGYTLMKYPQNINKGDNGFDKEHDRLWPGSRNGQRP